MTIPFKTIRTRAEKRKGGAKALNKLLPPRPDPKALIRLGDDRVLAEMSRRVFCAGFAWSVVEAKWPGFEKAFLKFDPGKLSLQPDSFISGASEPSVSDYARHCLGGKKTWKKR